MREELQFILHNSHHVSKKRHPMSMHDRAAQFAPFAALTGFDDEIDETARLTSEKHELTEDELDAVNAALAELMERENEKLRVSVLYFIPDKNKSGGSYATYIGDVRFINESSMQIEFVDGNEIPISGIASIMIER